jgi:hypothetical protein
MRLNGMQHDVIFYKNSSAYPAVVRSYVSTDLPNNYQADDTTDSHFDFFIPLVPGYSYDFNISGRIDVIDDLNNNTILRCGTVGNVALGLNGRYAFLAATNNTIFERDEWYVDNATFYCQDPDHTPGTNVNYDYACIGDKSGAMFSIHNETDRVRMIRFAYYGVTTKLSSLTTGAYTKESGFIKLERINKIGSALEYDNIVSNYAGFHDKYDLMKYLNAYWDTLELFKNGLTWTDQELKPQLVEVNNN